jgi:hypothetical protein
MFSGFLRRARVTARLSGSAAAVVVVAVIASGCGSPKAVDEAPGSGTPSPSAPSTEQQAADSALDAYRGYRRVYAELSHTADYQNTTELAKYAADPAKANVVFDLATMSKSGVVSTGDPVSSPTVASVNIATNPHSAVISDCLDNSGTDKINASTGKSVLVPGQSRRAKLSARVVRYDDGRWLVQKIDIDKSATC